MRENLNIPMPTLGGGAAWEEIGRVGEYCIQRNRLTGHHRLLDGANVRRAWGSLESCESVLSRLINEPPGVTRNPNLPMPTVGGAQFWADELVRCGWRIQRNVFTGHFRLLDSNDRRQAWGTFEQCETALRRLHEAAGIEPSSDRVAVLVHGILGWKERWEPMADALRRSGFEPVAINYPSTRGSIEEHVDQLALVMENLHEVEEINFVTHSMGALIVRQLLVDHPEIEARRIVMIAPPNQGAMTADMARDLFSYHLVFGPSGQQLITGVEAFVADLPEPPCDFAIIAGGRGDDHGFSPLIDGDDDGVVEVRSTHLPSESGFLLLPQTHNRIYRAPEAIAAAINFLEHGTLQAGTASGEAR